MPKIEQEVTAEYSVDDIKALIKTDVEKRMPEYVVESIRFDYDTVYDEGDWQGRSPPDIVVSGATIKMKK